MQARETRAVGHGHPLGTNTGLQGLGKAMTRTRGAQTPPAFTPALLEASVVVFSTRSCPRGRATPSPPVGAAGWSRRRGARRSHRRARLAALGRVWKPAFGKSPCFLCSELVSELCSDAAVPSSAAGCSGQVPVPVTTKRLRWWLPKHLRSPSHGQSGFTLHLPKPRPPATLKAAR